MERVFKALVVLSLATFIALGAAGCKKKDKGFDDGGLIGDEYGLTEQIDLGSYSNDPNTEVYKNIQFDYDKSDIRPDAKPILENIAMDLKANPAKYLLVEGHCDERGTNEYNLALGERRALATREYLVTLGIAPEKIDTISYGEERPLELGHDESAWKFNRRAEFKTYVTQ
jgi:peptidoglycan-associated lipoprotein